MMFSEFQRLKQDVASLKAMVTRALQGGKVRQAGDGGGRVGVIQTHDHTGTGEGGDLSIPSDAGDLGYTPAVLTDWDGDADPGDLDDALDQLAERVDDVEGGAGHAADIIQDADNDTKVEVEASADEDIVKVTAAGTLMAEIDSSRTKLHNLLAQDFGAELTLDTNGVVPVPTDRFHTIDTFGDAATDDAAGMVDTGITGDIVTLFISSAARHVTIKHNAASAGGIKFFLRDVADVTLTQITESITFSRVATSLWYEIGRNIFEYTTHILQFPAHAEDLATGVMGARPGTPAGESGEHGAFTAIRAKAIAGTAGTGTNTILVEADNNPAFSTPTVLFTLALNTSTEVDDTALDNAWASGDIFVRARCTAVGATAPKDVNVLFYFKEQAQNF